MELPAFLQSPKYNYSNPLSAEFGVYTQENLDTFLYRHLPKFALVIPLEQLADGLLVMKQMLNWEPVDLTYTKVGRVCAASSPTITDGKT